MQPLWYREDVAAPPRVQAATIPWWKTGWVVAPIWLTAGLLGAGVAALTSSPSPSPPLCPGVTMDGGHLEGIDYVERRSGKAGAELTLPMLVVLHGGGKNPALMADLAASGIPVKARIIAPTGFYEGPHWRDPKLQIPLREDAPQLAAFLEQIRRCRPTVGRPVVAGYDEGADLAYLLAVQQPDLVSQVILAGGMPDIVAGLPVAHVLGLHGMKDEVASYELANNAYHALIASGAPVRFLRMLGVDHSFAGALQIKLWQESARALADLQTTGD